ncbi:MAG: hypothetical protein ABI036_13235 [Fibrobacteria bacterium]
MKLFLLLIAFMNCVYALEMREDKFPDGTTKSIYYFSRENGDTVKVGKEKEYFKSGRLKRETNFKDNKKNGEEKIYDEEGLVVARNVYVDGKVTHSEDTFEQEHENGYGKKYYLGVDPLGLILGAIIEDGLAIPASPIGFGYHTDGFCGFKLAPALIINGEGGWGMTAGFVISDMPNSWVGNMFEIRYGYYDINKFGSSWNLIGMFYKNYQVKDHLLLFWGVDLGYGLNGIEIIKSENSQTGETRVLERNLKEGFMIGLGAGLGFDF